MCTGDIKSKDYFCTCNYKRSFQFVFYLVSLTKPHGIEGLEAEICGYGYGIITETEDKKYDWSLLSIKYGTDAEFLCYGGEIQLLLKMLPDSSVSYLIRAG